MPRSLIHLLLRDLWWAWGAAVGVLAILSLAGQGLRFLLELSVLAPDGWTTARLLICLVVGLSPVLLPAGFLLGALSTLERMGESGELQGMAALGIAPRQLSGVVLLASVPVLLLSLTAGLLGEPRARRQMRAELEQLESRALSQPLAPGEVRRLGEGWTMVRPTEGPALALLQDPTGLHLFAREGSWELEPTRRMLSARLLEGTLLHWPESSPPAAPGESSPPPSHPISTIGSFESLELLLPLPESSARREVLELSWQELVARVETLEAAGKNAGPERLTLARRLALPLSSLAFALALVPLSWRMRRQRSRGGVLAGVGLLLLYYLTVRWIEAHSVVAGTAPERWIWVPGLILAVAGVLGHAGLEGRHRSLWRTPTGSGNAGATR